MSYPPSGMSAKQCTRILLDKRPITDVMPTTFCTVHDSFDFQPGPGEVLVEVNWLSLRTAMRGWLRDARSYLPPVQIGEVMRSIGLATVVKTRRLQASRR
jgi:NADPH-dependent curcumin reductase CurA